MKKIQNIQALRGMAALSIVIFHLIPIEEKYGGVKTILPFFVQVGRLGTDLFFVISGFILVVIARGKHKSLAEAGKFLFRRVTRIYPTYLFYTLLVLVVFFIQPTWVNSSQGNQFDLWASLFLLPSDTLPLVMVAWALVHFMYFYILFSLIILFFSEKNLGIIVLIWGLGVIFLNMTMKTHSPTLDVITHPVTIEFISGCLLAVFYYKTNLIIKNNSLLILGVFAVALAVYGYLSYYQATGMIKPIGWWRPLLQGLPATMIVFSLVYAERNGYSLHNSLLAKVGNVSYSIYLSHVLTLSAVGRVWSLFSTDKVWDNFVMLPILIIAVVIVGFLSYRFVEEPLIKLTRKFF